MSIEIVEKPTHKCSVCGCSYSFGKEDIEEIVINTGVIKTPYATYKDVSDHTFLVRCPVCGEKHILRTTQVKKYESDD